MLPNHYHQDIKNISATNNARLFVGTHLNICSAESGAEAKKCKQMLASHYKDIKDRVPKGIDGTCRWFLDHEKFLRWYESTKSSLLWLFADPGCGKSVLARTLVDNERLNSGSSEPLICYFFFKHDDIHYQRIESAMCAILHQIFERKPALIKYALGDYENYGENLRDSFSLLWKIFVNVIKDPSISKIFCIIDALDECKSPGDLLRELRSFFSSSQEEIKLKFLLTSRPYSRIKRAFFNGDNLPLETDVIDGEGESEKISHEIDIVIEKEVSRIFATFEPPRPSEVKKAITEHLKTIKGRTYLWLHLILEVITESHEWSEHRFKALIDHIPTSLKEAYEEILSRISERDMPEAEQIFSFVIASVVPLSLNELYIAIEINKPLGERELIGPLAKIRLPDEQYFRDRVRNICGLFVTISDSRVYFIHQSAKEFLSGSKVQENTSSHPRNSRKSLELEQCHLSMVKSCMSYLSLEEFSNQPLHQEDNIIGREFQEAVLNFTRKYGFLRYSAKYWAFHFSRASAEDSRELLAQATALCNTKSSSFKVWFGVAWMAEDFFVSYQANFSDLTVVSYLGLVELVRSLLAKDVDVNYRDIYGRTPLIWAAMKGYLEVAELLIAHEMCEIDLRDIHGRTALSWAAEEGHYEIVDYLVMKQASVDTSDIDKRTPLYHAARHGNIMLVKFLISQPTVDINQVDRYGRTPLSAAVLHGHHEVMKLLVEEEGVNVDIRDSYGCTPLLYLAEYGWRTMNDLLIGHSQVDVMAENKQKRTPLILAAMNGHLHIVKGLFDKRRDKIEIDHKDIHGQTALIHAAKSNCVEITRYLVDHQADVNCQDESSRTPLSWAAAYGHLTIVKDLASRVKEVHFLNKNARTPLSCAAENGHISTIKFLAHTYKEDLNNKDEYGRTPIFFAAMKGHVKAVNYLLEQGADETLTTDSGHTPLSGAAANGHMAVVRLLAGRDCHMLKHHAPITLAAMNGHLRVVEMLIDEFGHKFNPSTKPSQSPICWAAANGHWKIVTLLIARGALLPSNGKIDAWPLRRAAFHGHLQTVTKLLKYSENVNAKYHVDDLTDSSFRAAKRGYARIFLLLKDRGANIRLKDVQSLLLSTAQDGDIESVEALTSISGVNIDYEDETGRTALLQAVANGHVSVARLLVEKGAGGSVDKGNGWCQIC